jgi:RNA recognition motif-containing protein
MGRIEASNLVLEDIEGARSRSSSEISTASYSPRSRSSSAISYNSAVTTDSEDQDYHTRHCPGDVESPNRVFVKGFGHETSEEELKSFFEIYGVVHEAKIVKDRQAGNSKGYAFISFDSQRIAEKVRTMGHVPYKERPGNRHRTCQDPEEESDFHSISSR